MTIAEWYSKTLVQERINTYGDLKFNGYNTISMLFGPLNEKKVEKSKPEKKNYHPSSGGLVFSSKH